MTSPYRAVLDHESWERHRTEPELLLFCDTPDGGLWVGIEKVGGGTIGQSYRGDWRYVVADWRGRVVADGDSLHTAMAHTHLETVDVLLDFETIED